jgi:hypothetical protein
VKKALFATAVAVAAAAGLIAAVVVSSEHGNGHERAAPGSTSPTTATGDTTAIGTQGTTATTTATTTLTATTSPVPTTTVKLPPPPGPKSPRRRTFVVGTVDDALAQSVASEARSQVALSRGAGFDAVVVTATWQRGSTRPSSVLLHALRNVSSAARLDHMRMFVVAWHGFARNTPRNGDERADFASFAAAVAKAVPHIRGVIVGNEPNLNTFWKPQFGSTGRDLAAAGYEDLLARTYDALKQAAPGVTVIGGAVSPRGADQPNGARPTHSPTAFVRDLGAAYRASGRHRPLMDVFAIHPYMQAARVPPTVRHPKTTSITLADYPKLVALLEEAFHGTGQRGATLPILYTEFGVQTPVPSSKLSAYEAGTTSNANDAVGFQTQTAYYREALALAYCQPTVQGLFIFHTFDEASLNGWQSGLYFADRSPKPSLPGFRRAVANLRAGKLTNCR